MATTPSFSIPPGLTNLLEEFVVKCIQENPEDLVEFAADYFNMLRRFKEKKQAAQASKAAEKKELEDKDDLPPVEAPKGGRSRRQAVAAEAYNPNDETDEKPVYHPKSNDQLKRLSEAVRNILLFKSCDQDQLSQVLGAMFEKRIQPEEMLIKQGDEGDNFYVIDSGVYDVFIDSNGKNIKVHTFIDTGSFGELALMYNCPRNATIIAKSEGCVWALDRSTFRRIVVGAAARKRKNYERLLQGVDMLKNLQENELMNLADALDAKIFKDGECIIKEKDDADCMYFIVEGKVRVTVSDGKIEKEVSNLHKGGYFGELALVMKQPRSASIYSLGESNCACLKIDAFERLLGPCMEIMKRNFGDYEKQRKKLGLDK